MRTKIYTKGGDKGETSLFGGARISKGHPQLEGYGGVDELNAVLGLCICDLQEPKNQDQSSALRIAESIEKVQNELFNVGAHLACGDDALRMKLPKLNGALTKELEKEIDFMTETLPELREFILPGGTRSAAILHLGRTVCRRAEREVVRFQNSAEPQGQTPIAHDVYLQIVVFLNRLSDYLFVAARYVNYKNQYGETKWQK